MRTRYAAFIRTLYDVIQGGAHVPFSNSYTHASFGKTWLPKSADFCFYRLAQRAHANFTENHTSFLVALTISGLRSPVASAMAGAAWVTGRIIYALGYTSNAGPDGRVV